jgi:hypothetical protein
MAVAIALAVTAFAARAQDNPYKAVAVNDFATYKMKVAVGALALDGSTTQIVTAKTDKEAKVKVTATFSGMETPPQEHTIDLTKPFDPTRVGALPQGAEAKVEKLKDGKETIRAGKDKEGKPRDYECTWTTYKITAKAANQNVDAEVKVWISPDAKLGLVKMELTGKVMNATDAAAAVDTRMTLELTEDGTKAQ